LSPVSYCYQLRYYPIKNTNRETPDRPSYVLTFQTMKMRVFHGTDHQTATQIINTDGFIDRTKGGGELGMGFYVGDSLAIAAAFAQGKFNTNGAVVAFDLDESEFSKLNIRLVKKREKVFILWRRIISLKKRFLYLFNVDVVVAPFATIDICMQYKFESQKGEDFMNGSDKNLV